MPIFIHDTIIVHNEKHMVNDVETGVKYTLSLCTEHEPHVIYFTRNPFLLPPAGNKHFHRDALRNPFLVFFLHIHAYIIYGQGATIRLFKQTNRFLSLTSVYN